jgi:flagellin
MSAFVLPFVVRSSLLQLQRGIHTIQAATRGISVITTLVQSAQALVTQADQTDDAKMRATLASQFDALLPQIDQIADGSGFNDINLLGGNDLVITISEDETERLVVKAFNDTAAGDLAINAAVNDWATGPDIESSSVQLTIALTFLRSQAQTLTASLLTMQIRADFTKAMINMLNSADNPRPTDSIEEGANLLALQTSQKLSTTALSLAARSDQNVLRLFR